MTGYLLTGSVLMGLYQPGEGRQRQRPADESGPDSPFQQQQHVLILTAMAAESQARCLEIQFSGGLNICFWQSQKSTSVNVLTNPSEPTDRVFLHLYHLESTVKQA